MVAGELLLKQGGRGLAFNEVKRTGSPAKKPSVDVICTHQQMDRRVGGIQPQPAQLSSVSIRGCVRHSISITSLAEGHCWIALIAGVRVSN